MLGYRKGADGQPEIIPEQAELIRMIYTSYLHGDSLQTIKSKVEAGGYKTVRGNTTWSTQALLRILQNEKYCGDVLLQKTFTDNVLTVVVGMFQGGIQALSRSHFAKIIQPEKSGEYFGLFDICGKGASFLGTMIVSVGSQLTGSANVCVGSLIVLFVVGFVLFRVSDQK